MMDSLITFFRRIKFVDIQLLYRHRLGITLSLIPVFLTFFLIVNGYSVNLSMSGMQISDANGWNACIKSFAHFGKFPVGASDWCMRRPLFPIIAAFEFRIFDSTQVLLIFNSLVFGIVTAWSYSKFRKILPFVFSTSLLVYIWSYWAIFAATQTMTESFGITLGILSLGFISIFLRDIQFRYLAYCTYSLSLAIMIRPGNLLAVFVPIVFVSAPEFSNHRVKFSSILFAIATLPQFLVESFAKMIGLSNFLHGGNSWATFYGLANGNQDWTAAYKIPKVAQAQSEIQMWEIVKTEAINVLRENPFDIIKNTFTNIAQLVFNHIPFFSPRSLPVTTPIKILNAILVTFLLVLLAKFLLNKSLPLVNRLGIFAFLITNVVFLGVIYKSDPFRTLSSTQSIFVFAWLYILSNHRRRNVRQRINTRKKSDDALAQKMALPSAVWMTIPVCTLMALIFTGPHIAINPELNVSEKCRTVSEFKVELGTMDFRRVSNIELPGMYWWEDTINAIPRGYLVQGLTIDKDRNIQQVNVFIKSQSVISKEILTHACFSFVENSELAVELNKISFVEGFISG